MSPETHRDAQKAAFKACGIFLSDVVHKPRKVGANVMSVAGREITEENPDPESFRTLTL